MFGKFQLKVNLLIRRGRNPVTGSALSPHPAPSAHTLIACCRATNPALLAAQGCCRIRPQ